VNQCFLATNCLAVTCFEHGQPLSSNRMVYSNNSSQVKNTAVNIVIVHQWATWKSTHCFFCRLSRKKTWFLLLSTDILHSSSSEFSSSNSHKSTSDTAALL